MFSHLGSVRQEERRRQVAGDAAENVNDGDAQPAGQLLQVPQDGHLEDHRHQAVQQAAGTCRQEKQKNNAECVTLRWFTWVQCWNLV